MALAYQPPSAASLEINRHLADPSVAGLAPYAMAAAAPSPYTVPPGAMSASVVLSPVKGGGGGGGVDALLQGPSPASAAAPMGFSMPAEIPPLQMTVSGGGGGGTLAAGGGLPTSFSNSSGGGGGDVNSAASFSSGGYTLPLSSLAFEPPPPPAG